MSYYEKYLQMEKWYKRQYIKMRIRYFIPDIIEKIRKITQR